VDGILNVNDIDEIFITVTIVNQKVKKGKLISEANSLEGH